MDKVQTAPAYADTEKNIASSEEEHAAKSEEVDLDQVGEREGYVLYAATVFPL